MTGGVDFRPMPLPVITDTWRLAMKWTHPTAGHAVNVFHVLAPPSATAAQVVTCWAAHDSASMWALTDNDSTSTEFSCTKLDGTTPTATVTYTGPTPSGSGEALPQLSAVLRLRTAIRGRNFRGRCFMPFLPEGSIADGKLNTANISTCTSAWTTFQAAIQADGTTPMSLVVASYVLANVNVVTSFGIGQVPGTLRPRGRRLVS